VPRDDEVAASLNALVDELSTQLGEAVTFERTWHVPDEIVSTRMSPREQGGATLSWVELGANEIVLGVGHDGWWEFGRTARGVEQVEQIVRAVVAGRVVEVFGLDRSQVTVTFDDGSQARSIGRRHIGGIIPTPGWKRWGRRVVYSPYS